MNVLINNQLLNLCAFLRQAGNGQGSQSDSRHNPLIVLFLLWKNLFSGVFVVRFIFDKRELVNKSVKCIGDEETHLILSGQAFCRRFHVDENYFQLDLSTG